VTIARVLLVGALSIACLGVDAPATDQPPIATLACVVGDSWTYLYSATATFGKGLSGSETFTQTDCGDHRVLHPSGSLIKPDITGDADGNVFSGFSVFTGTAERFKKPFPYYRLPLMAGKSWDSAVDIDTGDGELSGTGHWKTVAWETITVPAGTYVCLRKELKMSYDFSGSLGDTSGTYSATGWYCPSLRTEAKSISSDSFGDTSSSELTAVTLKQGT
jgi:hypothetical protein